MKTRLQGTGLVESSWRHTNLGSGVTAKWLVRSLLKIHFSFTVNLLLCKDNFQCMILLYDILPPYIFYFPRLSGGVIRPTMAPSYPTPSLRGVDSPRTGPQKGTNTRALPNHSSLTPQQVSLDTTPH
jgi:hypothetical protein